MQKGCKPRETYPIIPQNDPDIFCAARMLFLNPLHFPLIRKSSTFIGKALLLSKLKACN